MSFSVTFLAFYLLSCFLLVSCAPPEFHPSPVAGNATVNITGTQPPAKDHPTVSPQKLPEPSGKNESTNKTDSSAKKTGSSHPNVTKNTSSGQPTVADKTTKSIVVHIIDPTPNATAPSLAAKNGTTPMNITSSNETALPPHHKKPHYPTAPPLHTVTHPHVAVPINSMPESENILEDMAHPAPRPLQAAEKFNPTFGAIVAAICITTAVGGYVILMAWRKIEMDRYGNRQMLINEDDFGDIQDEDMRHFEASCIQIDG